MKLRYVFYLISLAALTAFGQINVYAEDQKISEEVKGMVDAWVEEPEAESQGTEETTEAESEEANEVANSVDEDSIEVDEIAEEPEEEIDRNYRGEVVQLWADNHLEENEYAQEMVTIGGNSTVDGVVDWSYVTIFGNSTLNGKVNGDMVTIFGSTEVNGYVDGELVVVMGSAKLGPKAVIDGDVVVIGGKLIKHPDARTRQGEVKISFLPETVLKRFSEFPILIQENLILFRPISSNVPFTMFVAGMFLAFYWVLAAFFPRYVEASASAMERRPGNSVMSGVLVMVLSIPVSLLLIITLVGPILLKLFILIASCVGKAAVFYLFGKKLLSVVKANSLNNLLLCIPLGGVAVYALYMIPFLGGFLWMGLTLFGLGATFVAMSEAYSAKRQAKLDAIRVAPKRTVPGDASSVTPPPAGTPLSEVDVSETIAFPRVGFWWRFIATVIDFIIIGAIQSTVFAGEALIPFAYFIVMWGWKGTTLGGMIFGLRVQKLNGEKIDWATAVIRSLSSFLSTVAVFIGFFWVAWDPEKQSWHDKIAGTTVVQVPRGYTWN